MICIFQKTKSTYLNLLLFESEIKAFLSWSSYNVTNRKFLKIIPWNTLTIFENDYRMNKQLH